MAKVKITITPKPQRGFSGSLINSQLRNPRVVGLLQLKIKQATKHIERYYKRRYKRKSVSGGSGDWPDIEESTKKKKQSSFILVDSGLLRSSITSRRRSKKVEVGIFSRESHPGGGGASVSRVARILQGSKNPRGKSWKIFPPLPTRTKRVIKRIFGDNFIVTFK